MMKPTLVIGASPNPDRYSNMAVRKLKKYGHDVTALAKRRDKIDDTVILDEWPENKFDTVTVYLRKDRQEEYYQKILDMHPKRVIFNPGAENEEFAQKLRDNGIEVLEACTLVMLSTDQF